MKKVLAILLALSMVLGLAACGGKSNNNSSNSNTAPKEDYTIRIYSNSNSTERVKWLQQAAKEAGFTISIDDNSVISGDTAAIQAANEKKDADIIFGLNETRWSQLIGGTYENLKIADWTPSWASKVGGYKYDGKAYGLVVQNVLMIYRTDEYGTNGKELHFDHWADLVDSGYKWYRQNKVGGTTNANINSAILYPYTDPNSPAGGISIDGWKTLWKYCANGVFSSDDSYKYGFDPLNKGDVQISTFYSSSLYGKLDAAKDGSEHPLTNENFKVMDIKDGTFYIAEYIGVVDKAGRSEAQTKIVKDFAEWFGSGEVQTAWAKEFDSFPCHEDAVKGAYGDNIPDIYKLAPFSTNMVKGTDMNYANYVIKHSAEWTNILTNLGFFWADPNAAPKEPDWNNLDWATLTQAKK